MQIYSNGVPIFNSFAAIGPMGPDGNPIGTIISYMGKAAPEDYLICDGTEHSIYDYPDLSDFIERQFGDKYYFGGSGDKFRVPDISDSIDANIIHCIKAIKAEPCGDIYSEEERVIGRWIDGKPLYRKVIKYTALKTNSWNFIYADSSINSIINAHGYILEGSKNLLTPNRNADFLFAKNDSAFADGLHTYTATNYTNPGIAIIEYTKTTD